MVIYVEGGYFSQALRITNLMQNGLSLDLDFFAFK